MMCMPTTELVALHCCVCGEPFQAPRGLAMVPDTINHMKLWELSGIVRGYGCPLCKGQTPAWLNDLEEEHREHVKHGFVVGWRDHVKGALLPKQIPFAAWPEREADPKFIWAEPDFLERLKATFPETVDLIQKLEGGVDLLRVHPDYNQPAQSDVFRYGVWHNISADLAWTEAETSSVRLTNVFVLQDIFGDNHALVDGCVWVLIGIDAPEKLEIYLEVLIQLVMVEHALAKYHMLTPQIVEGILGISQKAKPAGRLVPPPPPSPILTVNTDYLEEISTIESLYPQLGPVVNDDWMKWVPPADPPVPKYPPNGD